jgi:uncharacterized membrane protein YbhN (UPF0104 family)
MHKIKSYLQPFLHWLIIGATFFFLAGALHRHWQGVLAIRITNAGWWHLAIAFGITIISLLWAGAVWGIILQELQQPAHLKWAVPVFLKANIAKYLPGNIWHFYWRVIACKQQGFMVTAAIVSVVLEALLMAASALLFGLGGSVANYGIVPILVLIGIAIAIHPKILNPIVTKLSQAKAKSLSPESLDNNNGWQMTRYPGKVWLGEIVFLIFRTAGFIFTVWAIAPISLPDLPILIGAFGLAWLLGLIIPGAPGGAGVFEVTAIAILQQHFAISLILGFVALYRLMSTLAELLGAGLGVLLERFWLLEIPKKPNIL